MSQNNQGGANQTPSTPLIPNEIKIGEQVFVVNEVPELKTVFDSVITRVQQNEKSKLYADLDKNKGKVEELTSQVNSANNALQEVMSINQKQLADYQKMQSELAEYRKNNVVDQNQLVELIEKGFKEHLPPILQMYLQPVTEMTQEIKQKQNASYREAVIDDAKGRIFSEMVRGTTPDEIDASAKLAREMYEKYFPVQQQAPAQQPQQFQPPAQPIPGQQPPASFDGNGQQYVQNQMQQQAPQPAASNQPAIVPIVQRFNTPTSNDIPDIKNMHPEEFAKRREELFNKVKGVADAVSQEYLAAATTQGNVPSYAQQG